MGITPITNLAPLPLSRVADKELEPLPMQRVENSARTGDETYSPSKQGSASGAEDDESEGDGSEDDSSDDELQDLAAEDDSSDDEFQDLVTEDDVEPSTQPAAEPSNGRVSFLA
jgi:hypothetical protein